ncbi:diguanylate cyclase [Halopseudomonas pelagia]|uniref:Diguanylate cyclase n=1 Tax=Halopseudomonas pelagia TaxID=553151 RepID=A0AA91Z687_9GAMM|nr:diguanylate cyclase [Halopseudomonas pelagia]PCC99424.1 diguanylate cyclase [Halopseudomonas pelagia]QFY57256.1 diguanylate cyclase [Halopseudomonas pelagia]
MRPSSGERTSKSSFACRICWLYFLLASWCLASQAVASELQVGGDSSYALSGHLASLTNAGPELTLAQVQTRLDQFDAAEAQSISATNFGLTQDEVWLHLNFSTADAVPERWLLEVAHASLDRVDLYFAEQDSEYQLQQAGDLLPFSAKALPHRHHLFELNLLPDRQYSLYLRVASQGTLSVPVTLWQPDALWASDQFSYSFLSLYYGLALGLLIYNLFLFFSLREKLYLIYVPFVAFLALGQAGLAGLVGQFIWPNNALLTHLSPTASVSLAGLFGAIFVQRFLGATPRSLKMYWVMPVIGLIYALTFLCTLFISYFYAALVVNITSMMFAVAALIMGGASLYRRHPGARFFVLAWISLLLSILVMALHNLGVLPSNAFTTNALLFGSAAEMLLLSLALADRINSIQHTQDQAQQEALAVNRTMLGALRDNERQLETRVAERTLELEAANTQLQVSKQLLEQQANHDTLTGLANRKLLTDRLEGAQLRARRTNSSFALMMIDLDWFKAINDQHGHQAGDRVLIEVAGRLKAALRDVDTVARVGGDEFVLVIESVSNHAALTVIREKLLQAVLQPIHLHDEMWVSIGMSIGVAMYPDDAQDIDLLYSVADRAMYSAKPVSPMSVR